VLDRSHGAAFSLEMWMLATSLMPLKLTDRRSIRFDAMTDNTVVYDRQSETTRTKEAV